MANLQAVTTTGGEVVLKEADLKTFQKGLRGELIVPGGDGYEAARKVFNGMIDKRPAVIARCADATDVLRAVEFARTHDLLVAVRGGGHNIAGKAVCDGGLVIDLSAMKGMQVDPASRTARAEPGLTLGEFDRATQVHGLATPLGVISMTGIAGLTLGGGIGYLNGKHGLACDNVTSVDVVTADGRLLTANADENDDLFWAVRGGGGNFGIVTAFEYRLYPVGPVFFTAQRYEMHQARALLGFCREFAKECPDELTMWAVLGTSPDGLPIAAIRASYFGSLEEGKQALKPVTEFGSPISKDTRQIGYVELQSLLDSDFPTGKLHYWKSGFVLDLSDEAIGVLVEHAAEMPSPKSRIILEQMHGAASRVGPRETAFAHRHEQWDCLMLSHWADPQDTEKNIQWNRGLWEAMQPFLAPGVYVNYLPEGEGEERVRAAYGPNYERLVALKRKYDPANFFSVNQNIVPSG